MRPSCGMVLLAGVVILGGAAPGGVVRADELRVGTYNTQGLGSPGGASWNALVDILRRVDAGAVAIQEVLGPADRDHVDELAAEAGYPYQAISEISGTLSGNERTAVLSRLPIVDSVSYSAAELSGDPDANDITRDVFVAWIEVTPGRSPWAVITVHLKAGTSDTNKFRRQVEVRRVVQAIEKVRSATPGSPIVLVGDFNEDPRNGPFGSPVFDAPPPGLPVTYRLGADIAFPVVYDPFVTLEDAGLARLDAFHEDDPLDPVTHPATFRILDMLWLDRHADTAGTEVYDSCDDNGVDDPPPGNDLPKAGDPLACGVSDTASDHLDVFGDLVRLPVDQDGDAIDDAVDCDALDPRDGTPAEVASLRAEDAGAGTTRLTWQPAPTADRYDILRGRLGQAGDGVCRTDTDDDPTDTEYRDPEIPAAGSGWHYLVRAVDDGCGGAGPWGSSVDPAVCP